MGIWEKEGIWEDAVIIGERLTFGGWFFWVDRFCGQEENERVFGEGLFFLGEFDEFGEQ